MPVAPAICDDCGAIFPSGFAFSGGGSATLIGNKSGPCPVCGGVGSVPDGLYEFTGDTLRIVTSWSPARRHDLLEKLRAAQTAGRDRERAEAALRADPELGEVAKALADPARRGPVLGVRRCANRGAHDAAGVGFASGRRARTSNRTGNDAAEARDTPKASDDREAPAPAAAEGAPLKEALSEPPRDDGGRRPQPPTRRSPRGSYSAREAERVSRQRLSPHLN